MMALFPICVMDLDSFIQQIFVENLSFSILAKCQLLPNLVISALFFLTCNSIPDSFVLPPFPRSQFQAICSRNKKLTGVAEDSNLGGFCLEKEFSISVWILYSSKLSILWKKKFLKHHSPIIVSNSLRVFLCDAFNLCVSLSEICLLNHLANGLVDVCWAAQSLQLLSTYYRNPAGQIKKATCLLIILGLLCYLLRGLHLGPCDLKGLTVLWPEVAAWNLNLWPGDDKNDHLYSRAVGWGGVWNVLLFFS